MREFRIVLAVAVAILAANISALAQQQEVKYFSKSGAREVTASEAYFFEFKEVNASGGGTRTRYLAEDSSKVSFITYSDLDGGEYQSGIYDGPYYEWHKNGNLKVETTYSHGKQEGEHRNWHDNGQLHYKVNYKAGLAQDTLLAYYETGSVRRIEIYEDGEVLSGRVYNETGKEIKYFPREQMPEFPGGEEQLLRYLGNNIKYPRKMMKGNVQGLIVLYFVVKKDGSFGDIEVVKSLHKDGDAESLRVLKSMPAWKPGLEEGKPVDVRYTLPIRYSIK